MLKVVGIAAICAVCACPAVAKKGASIAARSTAPLPHDFDLATIPAAGALAREKALPREPVLPRNIDLRDFNPPAVQMEIADDGPVLSVGAMGAKFKNAPRLAHIAIGLDF